MIDNSHLTQNNAADSDPRPSTGRRRRAVSSTGFDEPGVVENSGTESGRDHNASSGRTTGNTSAGVANEAFDGGLDAPLNDPDADHDYLQRELDRQDRGVPGHTVMDHGAIRRALRLAGFDGTYDALSTGEEQRVRTLIRYQQADLFRPHLIGSPAMLARLDALDAAQPNFAAMTQLVRRAASLSFVSGSALTVPPTVLVGAPGIGKTRFTKALAAALGTSFDTVNGASLPDVASLTGYPPVWRGAGPGRIAKFLVGASTSSPVIFVDECEKVADADRTAHPLDRLLALLEPTTAAAYQDDNLQVPMRAQNAVLLFGCNSVDALSAPFLDRVVTIRIPDLTTDQRETVLAAMLAEVAGEIGLAISLGRSDALQPLRGLSLRRCRLALRLAVAQAVDGQRRFLLARDLADAVALLGRGEIRCPAGFVRLGVDDRDPV